MSIVIWIWEPWIWITTKIICLMSHPTSSRKFFAQHFQISLWTDARNNISIFLQQKYRNKYCS